MKINKYPGINKWLFTAAFLLASFGCKTQLHTAVPAYGVERGDQFFSIAVLPDTQYYTALKNGGTMQMFENQIKWIRDNRKSQNIAYVIHLGDITDHNKSVEWERAKTAIYKLEEDNIPYGLAVGNHDETPNGNPSKGDDNTDYTKYFGKSHFQGKPWYGGAMGGNDNSDNHFDVFTANGQKYLAMYFVYNDPNNKSYSADYEKKVMHWADSVLTKYSDHKAIMVTHGMIGKPKGSNSNFVPGEGNNNEPGNFTPQGKVIYNMAKNHGNVFLMLGGHISGEAFRRDVYSGSTIKTYLTDYQSRRNPPYGEKDRNGGNGTTRLMKFNTSKQTLSVVTFIPTPNGVVFETDGDSQFTEPLFN
jgi:hypothetical protein